MTNREYTDYFWPVLRKYYYDSEKGTGGFFKNPHLNECGKKLDTDLGITAWGSMFASKPYEEWWFMDDHSFRADQTSLPEEVKKLLKLLVESPYGYALIQAYKARKGIHELV